LATGFGVHPDASARALIRTGGFEARSSARRAADHQTCILGNERHSLGSAYFKTQVLRRKLGELN